MYDVTVCFVAHAKHLEVAGGFRCGGACVVINEGWFGCEALVERVVVCFGRGGRIFQMEFIWRLVAF